MLYASFSAQKWHIYIQKSKGNTYKCEKIILLVTFGKLLLLISSVIFWFSLMSWERFFNILLNLISVIPNYLLPQSLFYFGFWYIYLEVLSKKFFVLQYTGRTICYRKVMKLEYNYPAHLGSFLLFYGDMHYKF